MFSCGCGDPKISSTRGFSGHQLFQASISAKGLTTVGFPSLTVYNTEF